MKSHARAECEFSLPYDPSLRQKWMNGRLLNKWRKQYKDGLTGLCDLDLSNAQNQKRYHFGEWFTASCFIGLGWRVLLPKYTHPTRVQRRCATWEILGSKGFDLLLKKCKLPDKVGTRRVSRKPPKPDLLVYRRGQFFFVEVKRDRDKLSPAQRAFFAKIRRKLKCCVFIAKPKEQSKSPSGEKPVDLKAYLSRAMVMK